MVFEIVVVTCDLIKNEDLVFAITGVLLTYPALCPPQHPTLQAVSWPHSVLLKKILLLQHHKWSLLGKVRAQQLLIVKWEVGNCITMQCGWLHCKLLCVQLFILEVSRTV